VIRRLPVALQMDDVDALVGIEVERAGNAWVGEIHQKVDRNEEDRVPHSRSLVRQTGRW